MRLAPTVLFLVFLATTAVVHAGVQQQIDTLIAAPTPPDGVVFEIVEADDRALEWAIPEIQRYVKQLRRRFPELSIALVTHGNEMFALRSENRGRHELLHGRVQQLSQRADVDVHVCGAYAAMRGTSAEEFPAFVDVTPLGPRKVNDYQALGYVRIRIGKMR